MGFAPAPLQRTEYDLRFEADSPDASRSTCSPVLFDGPVVEVSTFNAEDAGSAGAVPPPSGHLNTEPSLLYDQILDSLQDGNTCEPSLLSPSSNSTDDLNDLMEFLYNDGFTPDHDSRTM